MATLGSLNHVPLSKIVSINHVSIGKAASFNHVEIVTSVPDSISTDPQILEYGWDGLPWLQDYFYVTSSGAWTLTKIDDPGWLNPDKFSGSAGTEKVTVQVDQTQEYREATLQLQTGTAIAYVYIIQYDF